MMRWIFENQCDGKQYTECLHLGAELVRWRSRSAVARPHVSSARPHDDNSSSSLERLFCFLQGVARSLSCSKEEPFHAWAVPLHAEGFGA